MQLVAFVIAGGVLVALSFQIGGVLGVVAGLWAAFNVAVVVRAWRAPDA